MMGKRMGLVTGIFLCVMAMVPNKMHSVNAAQYLETDVTEASEGCTMLGVRGTYYVDAQAALARVNEIRKEACEAGNVPDPRNPSRMLTASDYVPMKWSADLERVARIRAAEGGLARGFMGSGHNRLNGKSIWTVSYNGVTSGGECLAYNNNTSLIPGINQWYAEKSAWVAQTAGSVTGHYTSMIHPDHTYIGLGDFYTSAAAYPNTLAGAFSSTKAALDSAALPGYSDIIQKIEVKDTYIDSYYLEGSKILYTEETETLTPRVKLVNGEKTVSLWLVDKVAFSVSDDTVASVDENGTVTGKKSGNVTISVSKAGTVIATMDITVKCNHEKTLVSTKNPTCTATGEKVYQCDICNAKVTESLSMVSHSYEYGAADAEGRCKGTCSQCGHIIQIVPPTSYTVWWRNDTTATDGYYWSSLPASNPTGSTIKCWVKDVNGDENYRNMMVESSDESVLSVQMKSTGMYDLKIKTAGIVTISIYPEYNSALMKTYTLRVGDAGSIDMAKARVALPQESYPYSGQACTPVPTVVYRDCVLKQGTDYTVSYENHIAVGTAVVKIQGTGLFTGTLSKNFTIVHYPHHYGEWSVITPATCMEKGQKKRVCQECGECETADIPLAEHTPGETEEENLIQADCVHTGSYEAVVYCAVCGQEISRQEKEIPALGHAWDDGSVKEEATLTENGVMEYSCTKCGKTKETFIPALGSSISLTDAEAALREERFLYDGNEKTPAVDYVMVGGMEIAAEYYDVAYENNICVGTGYVVITGKAPCKDSIKVPFEIYCDHKEVIDAAIPATCVTAGKTAGSHCEICGEEMVKQEQIPELGHTGGTATCAKRAECSRCHAQYGGFDLENHTGNTRIVNGAAAAPNQNGYTGDVYCSDCNTLLSKGEVIPPEPTGEGNAVGSEKDMPVPAEGTELTALDGVRYTVVAFNADSPAVSYKGPANNKAAKVTIPSSVTINGVTYKVVSVGKEAFKGNTKLTRIVIGDNVESIGEAAFKNCGKLKTVKMGNQVKKIHVSAFEGCKALTSITIPSKVESIGEKAFYRCKKLKKITIKSKKLKAVGRYAVKGIPKNAAIKVPAGKLAPYKKLFTSKTGYKKTMKIKK